MLHDEIAHADRDVRARARARLEQIARLLDRWPEDFRPARRHDGPNEGRRDGRRGAASGRDRA